MGNHTKYLLYLGSVVSTSSGGLVSLYCTGTISLDSAGLIGSRVRHWDIHYAIDFGGLLPAKLTCLDLLAVSKSSPWAWVGLYPWSVAMFISLTFPSPHSNCVKKGHCSIFPSANYEHNSYMWASTQPHSALELACLEVSRVGLSCGH